MGVVCQDNPVIFCDTRYTVSEPSRLLLNSLYDRSGIPYGKYLLPPAPDDMFCRLEVASGRYLYGDKHCTQSLSSGYV